MSAHKAVMAYVERLARGTPGQTFVRVAVAGEYGQGYEICSRAFYEEGCSESEFICEARAVFVDGQMHSSVES